MMRLLMRRTFICLVITASVFSSAQASPFFAGLGDLPGGTSFSQAFGVSADGSVVVGFGSSASGDEAFRWTAGGGLVSLGDLPGGRFDSTAYGVSADGSIVVGQGITGEGPFGADSARAFIRDVDNGLRNLRDVLVDEFGLTSSLQGWTLSRATAISADGQVIVGFGTNPDGNTEAWVASLRPAVIPEPTSVALSGLGALGLLGYGWWRRRSF